MNMLAVSRGACGSFGFKTREVGTKQLLMLNAVELSVKEKLKEGWSRAVPLNVVLTTICCLSFSGCGMLTVDSERRSKLWEEYTAQGLAAERQKNFGEAKQLYEKALAVSEKFPKTDLRRAMTAIDYASLLHQEGDDARAQPLFEQAEADYERWRENRPPEEEINRVGKKMASCYLGLAQIYARQKLKDKADSHYSTAVAFTEKGYYPRRFIVKLLDEYAKFLNDNGEHEKARALTKPREAVSEGLQAQFMRKELVDVEWDKARNQAADLTDKGEHAKAFKVREEAIELCRTKYGAGDSRTMELIREQAIGLALADKFAEAEKVLERGIADHGEKSDPALSEMYNELARFYVKRGALDKGLQAAERAGQIAHELEEGALESDADFTIGTIYEKRDKRQEAMAKFVKGLKLRRGFTMDSTYYAMMHQLANDYIEEKKLSEAQVMLEEHAKLQKRIAPTIFYENTLRLLARVYDLQGKKDESRQAAATADRLKPI